jgi:adenylate cyclase
MPSEFAAFPTLALLPIPCCGGHGQLRLVRGVLAEEISAALARVPRLAMVSRSSVRAWAARGRPLSTAHAELGAAYALGAHCWVAARRITLFVQLIALPSAQPVWTTRLHASLQGLLDTQDAVGQRVAEAVGIAILEHGAASVGTGSSQPFDPPLHAAIGLMNRPQREAFEQAGAVLQLCAQRPQPALAHAWLAHWHLQKYLRGWEDRAQLALARAASARAVEQDPGCAFAAAMDGFVHLRGGDLPGAQARLEHALSIDPAEPWAWLFQSTLATFRDEGEWAWAAAGRARQLGLLDPLGHFYDTLGATAALAAGRHAAGLGLARSALRGNPFDTSSLRTMIACLVQLGYADRARAALGQLRRLDPAMTLGSYRDSFPQPDSAFFKRVYDALQEAGLPA